MPSIFSMALDAVNNPTHPDYDQESGRWTAGLEYGSSSDPAYDKLYKANPYVGQTYQKTWIDKLFGGIFRTGYDKWRDEMALNAAQYDASIADLIRSDEYNSPVQQSARERAAGLNPDMLGIGDVAESGSLEPDVQDAQIPDSDTQTIGTLVSGFAQNCLSAIGLASQLFKNSAEIKNIQSAMNGIQLDNNKKVVDLIDQIIVGSVPLDAWTAESGVDSYFNPIDLSMYGFTGEQLGNAQRILEDRRNSFKNNADILKSVYERYGYVSGVNKQVMSGLVPDKMSPYSGDDMFNVFLGSYANIARRILDLQQTNQLVEDETLVPQEQLNREIQGDIATDELSTLNGNKYGELSGENKSFFEKVQNIIASEKARMYGELQVKASSGDETAKMLLHALALQDMLQFEFSGGADFNLLKGLSSIAESVFGTGSKSRSGSTRSKSSGFGFNFDFTAKTK